MTHLGHRVVPSLLARDLGETIAFYQSVLGFHVTGLHPDERAPRWVELVRDGIAFQFHADPPHGMPPSPILSGTLYLYPSNVEALAAELSGRVPFVWGPEVMEYGMREFAVRDPNGYLLAFTEEA